MRILFIFIIMAFANVSIAQTITPVGFQQYEYGSSLLDNKNLRDSSTSKKWFVTSNTGVTAGYSFFGRGSASFIAAPFSLQLNRRLSNHLYAFANVTAVPAYLSFNHAFTANNFNKTNSSIFYRPSSLSMYSAASLGLMYVNDARTFSVSGSISVERSDYPWLYNTNANINKRNNASFSR